jgi:hypothetical protein
VTKFRERIRELVDGWALAVDRGWVSERQSTVFRT